MKTLRPIQREAYEVFKVFYKPKGYDTVKYLIVQNDLNIYEANKIDINHEDSIQRIEEFEKEIYPMDSASKIPSNPSQQHGFPQLEFEENFRWRYLFAYENRPKGSSIDSILDFRPRIDFDSKPVVYLTKSYQKLLELFYYRRYYPIPGFSFNRMIRKFDNPYKWKALRRYMNLSFSIGHDGEKFVGNSLATALSFDKTMTRAVIDFNLGYYGGQAILVKQNGSWILISVKDTWFVVT